MANLRGNMRRATPSLASFIAHAPPRSSCWGKQVSDAELDDLRGVALALRDRLEKQMQQAGIDLWVAPAALGPAPAGLHATGDPNMNLPWTTVGFPALTVPVGTVNDLPVGRRDLRRDSDDELLLTWAEEIASLVGGSIAR